ncbi:MAG: ornithine cyclodeaminase family protein [Paludibacterium sp.]|nr:ornithine cyclodeaminase family protein [Paludibacterium sp.]MBV8646551.1 ornithine cyclodeaminase family protein [Paludibacterium sp.]
MNHCGETLVADAAVVRRFLDKLAVRPAMERLFRDFASGSAVQPPQILTELPHGQGDFITYLGALAREQVFGAKLSPYLVVAGGRPIVSAWTSLMSMQTGQPLLFCDSSLLTAERTAGTTTLAIEYLAPATSRHLALIGTGPLGRAHLRHALHLRPWDTIAVYADDLRDNPAMQVEIKSIDRRIEIFDSAQACVAHAEVIMLCTSSSTPVLDVTKLTRPALITSISTNAVNAHEIAPGCLSSMDVYCDNKKSTPDSAGEMVLAAKQTGWQRESIVGDLAELVTGRSPLPDYQRHVFFRSIGMGLEDVSIAYALWCAMSAAEGGV